MVDIKINGDTYDEAALSEKAKKYVQRIKFVDAEILRTKAQLSVFETARMAYVLGLKEQVKRESSSNSTEDNYPDTISFEDEA